MDLKYKKHELRDHIYQIPDTYIGSVEPTQLDTYLYDTAAQRMVKKTITYVPGLYKIFDEVVVNALDHSMRLKADIAAKKEDVKPVKQIKIHIDRESGFIEVTNDGDGIDVEEHPTHKVPIPQLIFGELLTSTNYDPNEEKLWGGKNGYGAKCCSPDTLVPLFDGNIKMAKDVIVGDVVIGDDGHPRHVLGTITGTGKMYEVEQALGDSYKVNDEHTLTLHMPDHKVIFWSTNGWKMLWWDKTNQSIKEKFLVPRKHPTKGMDNADIKKAYDEMVAFSNTIDDDNVIDIALKDYLKLSNITQRRLAGVRGNCVCWEEKPVELDPYVLGLWLGDGCKTGGYSCDEKQNNEINNERIPNEYLVNSREVRLKVLAGIIDTDGSVSRDGTRIQISPGAAHKELVDDIIVLCRSLGFCCTLNTYDANCSYKINISGNIADIPTRKKCQNTKHRNTDKTTGYIRIKEIDDTDYVGIKVDGNERFLINDFTVTHNCTNIFSKEFVVETVDHRRKKFYSQKFSNNMKVCDKPTIRSSSKAPYTKIRFLPDFARFGMKAMSEDMFELFKKRALDACAVTDPSVSIVFNDTKLDVKNFEKYVDLYIGSKDQKPRAFEACGQRWEVVATISDNGVFDQVSFVNGILTSRGGKHVDYITNQITKKLADMAASKTKKDIKPQYIKDNLMVFVKSLIVNPSFDTQTKDALTTQMSKFGSKCELSDKFFTALYKTGITDKAISLTDFHDNKKLAKTDGKKTSRIFVPKLDDANWAGTKRSAECTLILTEGDSSRTMAISGLSVVGRDKYGVFPLRGKILNVKDAQVKKIMENEEITNLKKILGLQQGKDYKDASELRYGSIMIMTDQDSVTGDTPLLLRNPDGQVEIKTINDISQTEWEPTGSYHDDKEYSRTQFEVWTDKGWTAIKHVMRHKTTKRMFRVLTHTGCVDVTEDHSLLNQFAEKITPAECEVGQELLHSFPLFEASTPSDLSTDLASQNNLGVSNDEAYVMGLFWADGNCGIYTKNREEPVWCIVNTNRGYLDKAYNILQNTYPDVAFSIYTSHDGHDSPLAQHKLQAKGGKEVVRPLVDKYRSLFYDNMKQKKIPPLILNASHDVRKRFFEGFYDGDGAKTLGCKFDVADKIGTMGLFYLCKSLGYQVSINHVPKQPRVYRLTLTQSSGKPQLTPNVIKEIIDLGVTEQYVYDLETENHHFHAGVGQMIVHNTDGFHIKGLLFNVFQTLWPSLYKKDGFMTCMLTPIIKASNTKGDNLKFYTMTDYEEWQKVLEQSPDGLKGWKIKYYKGLGTSSETEAKDYFREMKRVTYMYGDKSADEALDLAFNKKRADDRKDWLMKYNRKTVLDYNKSKVPYEDFIHKELIHFSNRDLERSINNLCDGLKESTRKIVFGCFKRKLFKDEIKVAQLAAYISEVSAYHHGEASLQQAITAMAQTFVGTNNVNLLMPNGQFGSRVQNGMDAASPRYIYTVLSPLAKAVFREEDAAILNYVDDDGQVVEPEYYIPIVPMILINGGLGIGTGFSTNVPNHNPDDVVAWCQHMIAGIDRDVGAIDTKEQLQAAYITIENVQLPDIMPWYLGFKGAITKHKDGAYISRGAFHWVNDTTVEVTELPIGTWTDDYKEMLASMVTNGSRFLKDFESHYTAKNVRFILKMQPGARHALGGDTKFDAEFKLSSTKNLSLNNIHLYSADGAVQRFKSTTDVMKAWTLVRISKYFERKQHQLKTMEHDYKLISAKVKFIQDVIDGKVVVSNRKASDIVAQLKAHKYPSFKEDDSPTDASANIPLTGSGYFYLLRMPIYTLTYEKKIELEKQADDLKMAIDALRAKPIQHIWRDELAEFKTAWDCHKRAIEEEYEADLHNRPIAKTAAPAKRRRVQKTVSGH